MVYASTLLILLIALAQPCSSNIHRAVKSKQPHSRLPHQTPDMDHHQIPFQNTTSSFEGKLFQAQIFSVFAAISVGFTGILPLLVIPIEAGPKLQSGAGAKKLRLLLSFAVGGLLGDVFLHLLPESWKHLSSDDESAHRKMGFWVLLGIFTFVLIEMIFTNSESKEEEEKKVNGHICSEENENYLKSNGNLKKRITNKIASNGTVPNGSSNDLVHSNGISCDIIKKKEVERKSIDITGYLNLLANMMDNFTHGLAISASFLNSTRVGILTTFAILIHEIPHEVGDFAILLKSGFDRWGAAKAQIITASFGLCGALTALYVESADEIGTKTAFLLPFTAGGFIQIALVNVLPDLLKQSNPREALLQSLCILAGISSMGAVTLLTE